MFKIPNAKAIIMATPTTVNNNSFQRELLNNGIAKNQIVAQSCPNLANEISNDPEGSKVGKKNSVLGQKIFGTTARKNQRPFDAIPWMHSLWLP
ncbi:MAG: hypothetical protein CM1200mP28_12950 [Deltaproteobacteria bacterium]|nr:MAG: hypothetical protein CM1200mP28_12950 [Deltaproteobacteria bacterium]